MPTTPSGRATARLVTAGLLMFAMLLSIVGPTPRAALALSANPAVVISQVYGAGGNSGATLTNDYVELFNRSASTVSLSGWSIQYASATNTGNFGGNPVVALSGSLAPGQYYLVQLSGGANGSALPAADATGTISAAAGAGKFALISSTTGLACNGGSTPCDAAQIAQIIDLVGYGNANYFEGAGAAPTLSATTAALRAGNGCTDTNTNNADFSTGTPAPRNTASPLSPCGAPPADTAPSVASVTPANGVADVPVDASLSVAFSEAVSVGPDAFALSCDGSPVTLTVSGGPKSFTLDPATDLDSGASCTLTVVAAEVADQDADDPPDTMASDFTSGFATVTAVPPCLQPYTPIYAIQGSGATAAIIGTVTTQGVVVADYEGPSPAIRGFYLQEPAGDGNAETSDGIFVFNANNNSVNVGDLVRVTGSAAEFSGQTQIGSVSAIVSCGTGSVAPTPVELPVASSTFLERYEGMLITLPQNLVISEYFNYDRFGEYVLALPLPGEDRPYTPTSLETPGSAGYLARLDLNLRSRILIDDGSNAENPAAGNIHPNGLPFSLSNSFRGGDRVKDFTGVLGFGFSNYRIQPTTYGTYTAANPRPAAPEAVGGTLKVVGFNTLNYYLTLDYPTGDPLDNKCGPLQNQECRGADSDQPDEFARQRAKLLATLAGLNADVVGLIELENTPNVEPMADIVAGLPGYAYIPTGAIGSDAIKVGIIYKTATVQPVGAVAVLDSQAFVNPLGASVDRNRPAVAQTFQETATGARFTLVVNHLKSKGSGCGAGDDDTANGQGNCNLTRTLAAQALLSWLATDPTGSGDPDVMIVGDLNSYAKEEPIRTLERGGFTNLVAQLKGPLAYSYVFDGQAGYLDYAMASASLTAQVTGLTEWHINADEPDLIDYDTTFKSALQDSYYAPDAFRTADHDPVLVGLSLDGAAPTTTATASGATNPLCPAGCYQGSATVTLAASDSQSSVVGTQYRVNGGAFQPYAGPFTVSTEGSNLVEFFSTDSAGNVEAPKATTFKVSTFPTTSVLDSFGRRDGGLGIRWSGSTGGYVIRAGQVQVFGGGPIYWRGNFGSAQEAFVTLTTIDPTAIHQGLLLKVRNGSWQNGAIAVVYDVKAAAVVVKTYSKATHRWTRVGSFAATLQSGDKLGARALADGSVRVYVNCGLLGVAQAGSSFDNEGGSVGIWYFGAKGAKLDDFGGGNVR